MRRNKNKLHIPVDPTLYGVRNGSKATVPFEHYFFTVRTVKFSVRTVFFTVRTVIISVRTLYLPFERYFYRSNAIFYRSNGKKYRSNAKFYRSNGRISVRTVKIDVFHFYRSNGKIGSSFQPIKIHLTYHLLE